MKETQTNPGQVEKNKLEIQIDIKDAAPTKSTSGLQMLQTFREFADYLELYARGDVSVALDDLNDNNTPLIDLVPRIKIACNKYQISLMLAKRSGDPKMEFKAHAEFIHALLKDRYKAITEAATPDAEDVIAYISTPVFIKTSTSSIEASMGIYEFNDGKNLIIPACRPGDYTHMHELRRNLAIFYTDIHEDMYEDMTAAPKNDALFNNIHAWITSNIGDKAAVENYKNNSSKELTPPAPAAPAVSQRATFMLWGAECTIDQAQLERMVMRGLWGVAGGISLGLVIPLSSLAWGFEPNDDSSAHPDDLRSTMGIGIDALAYLSFTGGFMLGAGTRVIYENRGYIADTARNSTTRVLNGASGAVNYMRGMFSSYTSDRNPLLVAENSSINNNSNYGTANSICISNTRRFK